MLRRTRALYKRTRQVVLLILITCFVVVTAPTVRADTTLTSTDFAVVYQDIDLVRHASKQGLDEQVFKALSDPKVPNDVRAAIVNALGWSFTGQQNAKAYLGYIASNDRKKPSELMIADLTPEETFGLGYLLAMDNYSTQKAMGAIGGTGEVEQADALTLLDAAFDKLPNDFSVALIRSLAQARKAQISFDWCGVYKVVTGVIIGFPGERNMRSQAVEIVMDYIAPHQDYCRGT